MKKYRILHITHATVGGVAEYIKLFFNNMDRDKYEIYLICPENGKLKKDIEAMGINVYPVNINRDISIKDDIKSLIQISKLIKLIKPNLIHIHSTKAGILGKVAAFINGVPNIYNPHGWSFSMDVCKIKKYIYALIERYTSLFCNSIINISEHEYELAKKYRICKENKLQIIHNGIDISKYKNKQFSKSIILKELGIPEKSFIVGMVARISEAKDPFKFIRIAKEMCNNNDEIYFVLVGDGELKNDIEQAIIENKLENRVIITGWTEEVEKYISIFDVGILTSRWEGFGLALVEYMASLKPVVSTNAGGIKDIIKDKYNGTLIDIHSNEKKFINAIIELKEDKKLRTMYINNGKDMVEKEFNINKVIEEHEKLYNSILTLN